MDISTNYGFFLPSRDADDIADINQISDNFRTIDEKMVEKVEGKGLSENDYTAQDKGKVQGALQKNQGIEHAGRFMSVDENGDIIPSVLVVDATENKQDKFAEVTLQNDILTLTPQKKLRIRNLADPILDNDVVNKKYLETILEEKFSEFVNVSEVGQ